ncbi:peptidylprolyl isomerase [Sulfurimonas sp. SAG-AH-194-C20]|nr:peptidylprolyl isomerase [Sulfurimonas sp. SAG-AH-194-C20]MDF1878526.1 peptidylprolyl isomerase [Sulfurimonas sp. SAG-AH-194-C20]
MYKFHSLFLVLLLSLGFLSCSAESTQVDKQTSTLIDKATTTNPIIILQTTKGDLEIELFQKVAPLAVENFMIHIKNGYYDGIAFHRIIKDFMIQGGDPTESGAGGESIWHKDFEDEFVDKTFNKAGILAMANRGPKTNGSQFFITTAPTPWLNGHHTIFGQITPESFVTLEKLNNISTQRGDKPTSRVEIIKATIKSEGK